MKIICFYSNLTAIHMKMMAFFFLTSLHLHIKSTKLSIKTLKSKLQSHFHSKARLLNTIVKWAFAEALLMDILVCGTALLSTAFTKPRLNSHTNSVFTISHKRPQALSGVYDLDLSFVFKLP